MDSFGNIYLAGTTASFGAGRSDIVLLKYNSLGQQQWNTTWGGSDSENGYAIALDSSNNIFISGSKTTIGFPPIIPPITTAPDVVLVKFNSLGVAQWNATWGGSESEVGFAIALDSSENIYITGFTTSFGAGGLDMILAKYNSLGQLQWNTTWGGSDGEAGMVIALDSSDNIYIAGFTMSFGAIESDIALVKYNSLDQLQWNTTWGGSAAEFGNAIALDSSENIYLAGTTSSFGSGGDDIVLIKYTGFPDGNGAGPIPGYDLFLLLGAICVVSVILIKKQHKSTASHPTV